MPYFLLTFLPLIFTMSGANGVELTNQKNEKQDADKILEKVSEKIELPEQFLQRTGFL